MEFLDTVKYWPELCFLAFRLVLKFDLYSNIPALLLFKLTRKQHILIFSLPLLTNNQISDYNIIVRRKNGALTPIEYSILNAATHLYPQYGEFHGFQIAKEIEDKEGARRLTGLGTLYRALDRLEQQGFLKRRWEDPTIAAEEKRPRRRLYQVTGKLIPETSNVTSISKDPHVVLTLGELSS